MISVGVLYYSVGFVDLIGEVDMKMYLFI